MSALMASNELQEGQFYDNISDTEDESEGDQRAAAVAGTVPDVITRYSNERDLGSGGFTKTRFKRERKDEASSSLLNEGRSSSASFSTQASFEFGSEENIDDYRSQKLFWLRHPRVKENCKTVTAAFLLFFAGSVFLIAGIALASIQHDEEDNHKAIIFFVCAAICIIPGGYHIIYIYRATRGERGYNFESIPSFK